MLFRYVLSLVLMLAFTIQTAHVSAQNAFPEPDTLQYELSEIEIQASRDIETESSAPFSVSVMTRTLESQLSEPGFSLDQVVQDVPGLWINDRQNYALGERVSIRGMGWRTAFGVRGIYVLMDDIPLTVPDGQTVMDVLDPAMIRQAEVLRGPSSSFWGNASGGTMVISTRPATYETGLNVRTYGGAHNTYSAQVSGTHQEGPRGYNLNVSYLNRDGYRDHSSHTALRMTGHMHWQLQDDRDLQISGAFVDAPDTRHPGSLSREDLDDDRQQAAGLFENASAGKIWRQGQLGMTLRSVSRIGQVQGTVYGLARSLHNPLPFADIEVDRLTGGTRLSVTNEFRFLRWGVGMDAAIQSDDRRNYDYVDMDQFERGDIVIDQQETVINGALFGRVGTNWDHFNISGGMRFDAIRFDNDDRLQTGGEDVSGDRTFTSVSPSAGLSWKSAPGLAYVNYGTSFETPTTTELVNRPDMTGGFNPDIEPERSRSLEAGFRGGWSPLQLRYDVAVFRMNVRDQLVSFRTEEGGDRDFYRNAGKTRHDGVEISARWHPAGWISLSGSYNWSHFTFRESVDTEQVTFVSGNRLPGIPEHRLVTGLSLTPRDFRIDLTAEFLDSYYVDNANTEKNPGYEVVHAKLSHNGLPLAENLSIQPFIKINNVTDVRYNSSVSINANAGRYYEPAPGRSVYAGFSLRL